MDFIFSLAHYCEIHGPTSVICTQVLPEPCHTCSPPAESQSPLAHDATSLDPLSLTPSSDPDAGPLPHQYDATQPSQAFGAAEDLDDSCASCSFDIPDDVSRKLPEGAPGSPSKGRTARHGSPVLRTRGSVVADQDCAVDLDQSKVIPDLDAPHTPPTSTSSDADSPQLSGLLLSHPSPRSERKSSSSSTGKRHKHQLTYLTTRHPTQPTLYTALRHSCIRTLSLENLPRGTPSGPLLFGDALSGHTIAFIFRLPDPYARGRRRTYALLALHPGRDAARVGRAMARVVTFFRQIAGWIVALAERASERAGADLDMAGAAPREHSPVEEAPTPRAGPVSSFLSAKRGGNDAPRRRIYGNPDVMNAGRVNAPHGRGTKGAAGAKGLAELLGREGLFVELHVAFVKALVLLGREIGAA